jgi:hypothetical protein
MQAVHLRGAGFNSDDTFPIASARRVPIPVMAVVESGYLI